MNERSVARKYARAFIKLFGASLPTDFLAHAEQLRSYLEEHSEAFFYLKLSVIPVSIKEHIMVRVLQRFELGSDFLKLISLLVKHKRLHLIWYIIDEIIRVYKLEHHIEEFVVATAQEAGAAFLEELEHFLSQATNSTVIIHATVDPTLIAGVRALSDDYKWEYSVRDRLNQIRRLQ